ncbi:hypothetical protein Y032_0767g2185 [Ancylostoma ceylanicum]|uniref:Uncharacterized protein n=1 Tax=Ancylostoma ceylanicum TaxID=53326 RepID=A0A016WDQ2_9BILA|nr:hypothetical protein Y032_0767g2185 [Ancylostoma ceylanicum]
MSLSVTIVLCALAQISATTAIITMLFCSRLYRRKAGGSAEGGMDDMVYPPRVSFKDSGEMEIDYDVDRSHRRRHRETSVSNQFRA